MKHFLGPPRAIRLFVTACLGEMGTASAVNAVTRMFQTFPSIRFGLMVGIGGGVSRKVRPGIALQPWMHSPIV
ncbi:hypothetical protein GGR54DRAFT_598611 [Hypoxylon sp. NC1633]|nr:hypothetical protein GGR54DRAFT_598611 [Hypoxylon sp. NC1633]